MQQRACFTIVCVLTFSSLVRAESGNGANVRQPASVATEPLELARVRYRQGVGAFKEGHFREAIDLFLEADQLAPSGALSFNIATAYEKIEQPAAALRWYRDYLRRSPDAPDHPDVEATVHRFELGLAQSGVQQLTVTSAPPAAKVVIDGRAVGATPWTGELAPGSHRLELGLDGRAPSSQSIDLPADHAIDIAVELQPEEAHAAPPDAQRPPVAGAVPDATPTPKRNVKGSGLTTAGWIGVAAGGAALGGALVFEILRHSAESAAESDRTQVGYADKLDTMHGRQTAARVMAGAGAALAVTGGVLLWFGRTPAEAGPTAVGIGCDAVACGSTLRGKF